MALFDNYCSGCGKFIPTFAIDRQGNVPKVFCNSVCRTDFDNEDRLQHLKVIVPFKKSVSAEELTKRMSKKPWNNKEYLTEQIPV